MKKILSSKYGWLILLVLAILLNSLASLFHSRIDLTAEKRYTLSEPTRKMLRGLDSTVEITVLLSGDMPAGFKKLANSSKEMLQQFKEIAHSRIHYEFKQPTEGLNDSARATLMDSLQRLGLSPMNVKAQVKEGEGQEQRFIYPGAVIRYKGRSTAVDFLQGQSSVDGLNSLNNAEALLEYKLAGTIRKITQDSLPVVGYLLGNGEPFSYNVYDFVEHNLKKNYRFAFLPIDSVALIPPVFDALVITKPTVKFSEDQKLKLDQYVMQGGKIIWMIDNLYAEMDSLMRTQNEFIAFDRGLNLEDQLFNYGVRINQDLVQDLNCDVYPIVVGTSGGKPQSQLLPWNYFPLLANYSGHPIAKNLDYVLSQFPNSLDTVNTKNAQGLKKTILLASSEGTRLLSTPAKVSIQELQNETNKQYFNHPSTAVAVLLEGRFRSLFTHRLGSDQAAYLSKLGQPFLEQGVRENAMIVISDGDIALNPVSQQKGPLPMGMNPYTQYKYANSEFISNCLEYLTDSSGILETRAKDYTLRLLDKKKLQEDKSRWQLISLLVPLVLVIGLGLLFQFIRRKSFR